MGGKRSSAFSESVRLVIDGRAKGLCELCGMQVTSPQYHHRRPRGIGGTKRIETGQAQNALLLHQNCHTRVESNRSASYQAGWLIPQNSDPSEVPVLLWNGWFVLDSFGSCDPWIFNAEVDDLRKVNVLHSLEAGE